MTTEATTADRLRAILVFVATLATIAFNGLASTGYVDGVTQETISNKYQTVLTPAGYAFSIWGVIYLGILVFSVFQLLPANLAVFRPIRSLFLVSCVLNCGWILCWNREMLGVCLALIAALAGVLFLMLVSLRRVDRSALFTRIPFGLYAGWVTAATLVSITIFIRYLGVDLSPTVWNAVGIGLLTVAAVIAVVVRLGLQNYLFPLAVAWAAAAIGVKQSGNTAIVVASAVCMIVGLVMAVSFVMDQKSTTT